MDAVKFLKERARMCEANQTGEMTCENCAAYKGVSQCYKLGEPKDPEKMVAIVEQWAAEHPVKTRQSEFLKMFPNVILNDKGQPSLCAKLLDTTYHRVGGCGLDVDTCQRCMDNFWGQEVEE